MAIDFEKVKGFNKLTEQHQKLFKSVYKMHNVGLGIDAKSEYIPISVKADAKQNCLIVRFKNGDWLHYTPTGDWY